MTEPETGPGSARIGVVEDFVPPGDCARIVSALRATPATSRYNGPRRLELPARQLLVSDPAVYRLVSAVRRRIRDSVRACYSEPNELFADFTVLTEMRAGDRHVRHADSERRTGDSWEPNHTPQRTYTGIVYLTSANADFRGGTITFTALGRPIEPKAGLLVVFRCDRRYEHEVAPVLEGSRVALSCWFTGSRRHAEPWPDPPP